MGLDMDLMGRKSIWRNHDAPENDLLEDGFNLSEKILELGSWRKHLNLHDFIVETFAGGNDEFQDIDLALEDIDKIIEAAGLFFGESNGSDEQARTDIAVFEAAKKWVNEKGPNEWRSVFYRATP